jgi:hypothetical protein
MIRHYVQEYEILMKLRFPACSQVAGKRIEQGLTLFDLSGNGNWGMNSQTKRLFQLASQTGSDYYPEIMGNLLVTNAPMSFTAIWMVAKGFLDEKTRKKIQILGGSFKSEILKFLDDENIPEFLGGKCTCEELGGCINSNIGPWNDYELTETGIRKKGAMTEEVKEEETKQD